MIRMVELECPNCGAALQKINKDTCKCGYCNAYFLIDRQEEKVVVVPQETKVEQSGSSGVFWGTVIVFFVVLISAIVITITDKQKEEPVQEEVVTVQEITSPYFTEFLQKAFEKTPQTITPEELASITMLSFDDRMEDSILEYRIGQKEVQQVTIEAPLYPRFDDLIYFPGLKELYLDGADLQKGQLAEGVKLTHIRCSNSPEKLAEVLESTEDLESLEWSYVREEKLSGMAAFPNLRKLTLRGSDLKDISEVTLLSKIEYLSVNSDALTDVSAIGMLPTLKELEIEGDKIKDLAFLEGKCKLTSLKVIDTVIVDLSFLEYQPGLKSLTLERNDDLKDYACIDHLSELEQLSIYATSGENMPDYGKLTKLQKLLIHGAKNIDTVQNLPDLKVLHVIGGSNVDLALFAGLSSLEELKLRSSYGELVHVDKLKEIPNLKRLDISDTDLLQDITAIFEIPSLEDLNLSNSQLGITLSELAANENLRFLNLNEVKFLKNIKVQTDGFVTMADYDKVEFDEYVDMFAQFSNLEELYLKGDKVDSIEFVKDLSRLRMLDISDNYVRDIKPLGTLAGFEILYCSENPVTQGLDLADRFEIVR